MSGPNAAHRALARLEADWPARVTVVTQNIDDLHDRAGSHDLIHMHGELLKAACAHCAAVTEVRGDLSVADVCAACGRTGGMRPDVVWFGEMPYRMEEIAEALDACGLFVSIGTSGTVYPAAGFVREARLAGRAHCLELNLEASDGASFFPREPRGPGDRPCPRLRRPGAGAALTPGVGMRLRRPSPGQSPARCDRPTPALPGRRAVRPGP